MKIYEIGTGYTPIPAQMGAATEIVVEELTRSLIKLGEDAEILDISSECRAETDLPITQIKVMKSFTKKDVSLGIMHKLKRVFYSIALAKKLKKILKNTDEKVIIHFHNQYNMYFFLKLVPEKLREKAVLAYTVHSYIWGTKWEEIENTVKKKYFQEITCVKNADVVFVLNDITTEHFTTKLGVERNKIHKIINGVNINKYTRLDDNTIASLRKENNLENKKVILQVGSVCDRKNQLGSVEMLADYMQKNREVVYLYAGGIIDDEYQQKIKQLASEKGISNQVRYAGELAPGVKLNEYYNMSDCSVFTSKLESFGLVIIEAISSDTPVILSSNPLFDLKSGYYVYSNKDEFVSIVDKLINEPHNDFDCKEVLDKYNWDTVADKHRKLFEKVKLNG